MVRKKEQDELIAAAVAEYQRCRDKEALAQRHRISTRTLRRWCDRVHHDPALAQIVQEKSKLLDKGWCEEAQEFLAEALRKARELIRKAESVKDIRAVMGAIKIVGDLQTVREALNGQQPDAHPPRPKLTAPPGNAGIAGAPAAPIH